MYETAEEFRIVLSNRLQTERVEDCWSEVKEAVCGARRSSERIQNARTTRMDDRKKHE